MGSIFYMGIVQRRAVVSFQIDFRCGIPMHCFGYCQWKIKPKAKGNSGSAQEYITNSLRNTLGAFLGQTIKIAIVETLTSVMEAIRTINAYGN